MEKNKQKRIFDEWLSKHKSLLFKVVRAYSFTRHDQDDLFQEIAIQVWNSIPNFRGDATVTTWLYRVALYTAIAWTRKEKKHHTGKESLNGVKHTMTATSKLKDRRLDWIYHQIAQLDEIDRSLMLLMLDGFSYKEMATTLGISESNVGVKINRIKKRLAHKSRKETSYGL